MRTNKKPQFILKIGALLILVSGIISIAISIPINAMYNKVDPYGIFGHIGIINGLAAMLFGSVLFWLSRRSFSTPVQKIVLGIIVMVTGHIGAIAGALLVGTAGLLLCYIAGVWFIVLGIKDLVNERPSKLK